MAIRITISLLLICFLSSFDRPPCSNTNPIFGKCWPFQKEYRQELARQIKRIDTGKISYYIDGISKKNDKIYLTISVQGKDLCALCIMDITYLPRKSKLRPILETYTDPYIGVELKGLKYAIDTSGGNYNFVYKGLDSLGTM